MASTAAIYTAPRPRRSTSSSTTLLGGTRSIEAVFSVLFLDDSAETAVVDLLRPRAAIPLVFRSLLARVLEARSNSYWRTTFCSGIQIACLNGFFGSTLSTTVQIEYGSIRLFSFE
ncbi:hypothetical protein M6B38_274625 [Iris pallida]|uniref:Uncharacterized protein n=1 Tax=Iris pallida TaxID=29817 RepID=A0AAX6I627_IRIPA|nr:hypothetical protein M6B38_274625 [Iris pallida]